MKVITEHAAYDVDVEAGTLTRYPTHADANDLDRDGEPVDLLKVLHLELGDRAMFIVGAADEDDDKSAWLRVTTPVKELIP